jgi:hypothetical protein
LLFEFNPNPNPRFGLLFEFFGSFWAGVYGGI